MIDLPKLELSKLISPGPVTTAVTDSTTFDAVPFAFLRITRISAISAADAVETTATDESTIWFESAEVLPAERNAVEVAAEATFESAATPATTAAPPAFTPNAMSCTVRCQTKPWFTAASMSPVAP